MQGLNKKKLSLAVTTIAIGLTSFASVAGTSIDSASQSAQLSSEAPVVGGPTGSVMTEGYAKSIASFAYVWGWPLVNMHNRQVVFSQVPYQMYLSGAMPAAPINQLTMLTDYISPEMRDIAHPNQDVVYGFSMLDLSKEPIVVQVPDFGDRFWTVMAEDQRTDSFAEMGTVHGSKSGFYLLVGPDWQGEKPDGIEEVFRSTTNLGVVIPRAFMDDTKEDRAAVQEPVSKLAVYPLSQFDGKMKTTDWSSLPDVTDPNAGKTAGEKAWVNPETFFTADQLGAVLKEVPPQPGEEVLYQQFSELLAEAEKNPAIMAVLVEAAKEAEKNVLPDLFRLENVGKRVDNGWAKPQNNGRFGTDYLTRLEVAKSNIFTNDYKETNYLYQYNDSNGQRINGNNNYTITFPKGMTPPVIDNGFWSLTMYDHNHFFHHNEINRYSVGTKNKEMKYNQDGSLTIYIQNKRPNEEKVSNWLPAPKDDIAMTIRAYGPTEALMNNHWQAPAVIKTK